MTPRHRSSSFLPALVLVAWCCGCGESETASAPEIALTPAEWTDSLRLDDRAGGMLEFYGNFYNLSVASHDPNPYRAEYRAGWVQGKLSRGLVPAARDNTLEGAVREAGLPVELIGPLKWIVELVLTVNLDYTLDWVERCPDPGVREKMCCLIYRMLGIARGASGEGPQETRFDGEEILDLDFFQGHGLELSYGQDEVSFQDIHFLNAATDLVDLASVLLPVGALADRCSAFIVRTGTDLILAHTTWTLYSLSLPMRVNLRVNGEYLSAQAMAPGLLASATDFGYNGHGLIFNETTVTQQERARPQVGALWTCWRAALAETYARSLEEFFDYLSLENSGTYMNGYQIAEADTKRFGLVEMDETRFTFFRPREEGGYEVVCRPDCATQEYDQTMLTPDTLIGFNFPVSHAVRESLHYPADPASRDARYGQFLERIDTVTDLASARALITFHDPRVPRSIYSRWDRVESHPRPGGAVDAKVVSASLLLPYLQGAGALEPGFWWGRSDSCWMKFGPPYEEIGAFVWSESPWKDWRHDLLPDRMAGDWQMYFSHIQ